MKNETSRLLLGLTGPTGAGKGEVATLLQEAGIPVVDTDRLARVVTLPGHPCLAALAEEFSSAILCEDGSLDRAALAKAAFATPQNTLRLNAITHPHIIEETERVLQNIWDEGACIAVIDAPLLFESGMHRLCDHTVAVLAPAKERCRRICQRDGLTEEQARLRMNAQPKDIYYKEHADEVLYNHGDLDTFRNTVQAWIARLKGEDYDT